MFPYCLFFTSSTKKQLLHKMSSAFIHWIKNQVWWVCQGKLKYTELLSAWLIICQNKLVGLMLNRLLFLPMINTIRICARILKDFQLRNSFLRTCCFDIFTSDKSYSSKTYCQTNQTQLQKEHIFAHRNLPLFLIPCHLWTAAYLTIYRCLPISVKAFRTDRCDRS